ncbi:hypothetical protein ABW19_dt0209377 [Dactylella cylindrospora]|nr:hypothetical protein ABW19_dt0209377 [Dactylella cylindrospora]
MNPNAKPYPRPYTDLMEKNGRHWENKTGTLQHPLLISYCVLYVGSFAPYTEIDQTQPGPDVRPGMDARPGQPPPTGTGPSPPPPPSTTTPPAKTTPDLKPIVDTGPPTNRGHNPSSAQHGHYFLHIGSWANDKSHQRDPWLGLG